MLLIGFYWPCKAHLITYIVCKYMSCILLDEKSKCVFNMLLLDYVLECISFYVWFAVMTDILLYRAIWGHSEESDTFIANTYVTLLNCEWMLKLWNGHMMCVHLNIQRIGTRGTDAKPQTDDFLNSPNHETSYLCLVSVVTPFISRKEKYKVTTSNSLSFLDNIQRQYTIPSLYFFVLLQFTMVSLNFIFIQICYN